MPIYELGPERLRALPTVRFADIGVRERQDLQRLLRDQVDVIAPGTLVIAEEHGEWEDSRRRIDLLAIDRDANLVVIELKRTEDGGHMELQALRYAAMVSTMTFEQATEAYARLLAQDPTEADKSDAESRILDFLGWDEPNEDAFAQDVRIVLVSADFSRELTTAVLWLNERSLDIRCVRLIPYVDAGRTLLDVQQVIPLPETEDFIVRQKQKHRQERQAKLDRSPWTGLWFVNVGMNDNNARSWDKCRELGFLSAGGGRKYSDSLKKLRPGSRVLAFQKQRGYVGYGIVSDAAQPFSAVALDDGRFLSSAAPGIDRHPDDPELREFAVRVTWERAFDLEDARWFPGAFANQNIVCRLTHRPTIDYLAKEFGFEEASDNAESTGH